MSDVLFYATADTHAPEEADGGAWRSLRAVRGDAVYGIARLAALCLEDGVPMVIAGDLFDGPDPAPDAQGAVYEALAPMLKAGLGVYYNLGNHDRGRDWLAPLARLGLPVRRVDGKVYRDPAGFTVTGLSYVPPASFAEAVKAVQPADVGLYHQQWAEWAGGGGRVSTASLPAHRVAVCGDVHVHALIEGKGGPTLALSPGPLAPQSIVEFGPSRAYAVGRDFSAWSVVLPGRLYRLVEVRTARDAAEALIVAAAMEPLPHLPEHLQTPVLAVRLVRPIDGLVDSLREFEAEGRFVLRVVDAASAPVETVSAPAAPARHGGDALTAAVTHWPGLDPAVRALALAVTADGADPDDELTRARAAYDLETAEDAGAQAAAPSGA